MRILEKNASRIAITTDMWTSSNQKKGFMAITTHFIDDNWEMQSRIMRFIYVPCPHTADVLANVLEGAEAEIEKHKKFIYELFEDYKTNTYENAKSQEHGGSTSNNDKSESGLFDDYSSFVAKKNTSEGIILELEHYLEEKVCSPNIDLDILAWWKTNGMKYPLLQRIARDVLAIPITTVASDSSFSTSGRLVSPHCSRLHQKTIEALMCAQSWLLNEIRATCSKETEAYCKTIEYDYDDSDEERDFNE
ncbi:hypothetical protein QVD17_37868 [Tagetes erecta]|uniref:HAT C-terminal dimerisation domain-containing protein n=1 Tax=Tagetes erecta TaxID=13708 RepID=A0AAD8JUT4_TARER|nr:hypothetical protein QVD17_37868 [Tagetes erecta]